MLDFFNEKITKQFTIQTLKTYFADRYTELRDVEKENYPDLVDKWKKMGVEVTRAINKEFLEGLNTHLKNKTITLKSSRSIDRCLWTYEREKTETKLKQIKDAYNKKLTKLNKNKYNLVEIVDLFIFTSIKKDVKNEQLLAVVETTKPKNFRYIYIVSFFRIYEIDSKAKTCKIIDYDNKFINEILEANYYTKFSWL